MSLYPPWDERNDPDPDRVEVPEPLAGFYEEWEAGFFKEWEGPGEGGDDGGQREGEEASEG